MKQLTSNDFLSRTVVFKGMTLSSCPSARSLPNEGIKCVFALRKGRGDLEDSLAPCRFGHQNIGRSVSSVIWEQKRDIRGYLRRPCHDPQRQTHHCPFSTEGHIPRGFANDCALAGTLSCIESLDSFRTCGNASTSLQKAVCIRLRRTAYDNWLPYAYGH